MKRNVDTARARGQPIAGSRPFRWGWALAALLAAANADARMYQWVNPATGLAQMSGTPPSWYRGAQPGPRVLVFENGMLVDDTSLRVGTDRARALRQAAFDEVEQRRELAALQQLEETARREARRAERERQAARPGAETASAPSESGQSELQVGAPEQFTADTIDRLKAIIAAFDRLGEAVGEVPAVAPE